MPDVLKAEPLARQYVRGEPTPIDNPNDTLVREHYARLVQERLASQPRQPERLTAAAPVQRLAVSDEDVRRAYYESAGYSMWITSMQLDPLQLMVCDDASGKYYRVPIELSGEEFKFGDPVEVAIEYKDVSTPEGAKAAASTVVWTSRATSVALDGQPVATEPVTPAATDPAPIVPAPSVPRVDPVAGAAIRGMAGAPVKPPAPATPPAGDPAPTTERLSTVDGTKMREALGLSADASDEELWAAIAAAQPNTEPTTPATEPVTDAAASVAGVAQAAAASHGDLILVDRTQIAALQASARKGEQAWATLRTNERDQVLSKAMADGKFPPARRDHYARLWDADPEGTRALVAALAPNLIPTSLSGHMGSDEAASEAAVAYDALYGKAV